MHDLDRALQEFESQSQMPGSYEFAQQGEAEGEYDLEGEGDYESDSEYQGEGDFEGSDEAEGDYEAEGSYEAEGDYETGQYEGEGEYAGEGQLASSGPIFDEVEEMEQAASLLEVQDEGELDQFLGVLIDKVKNKLTGFLPPDVQKALGDSLKKVAGIALPKIGAALGNIVLPGAGGALGAAAGSNAAKLFGLELEGMSYEDQEFEVARRIVSLGAEATRVATEAGAPDAGPGATDAAKGALVQAAQTHAPGLAASVAAAPAYQPMPYPPTEYPPMPSARRRYGRGPRRRTGRWYRRGHRIVLVGV